MAAFQQQLIWHLKKEDLEKLLSEAAGNYSALVFTLGIDDSANTQYQAYLVNEGAAKTTDPVTSTARVCPVPPDCS
jgi:predicted cupin superfamily sugar epimerase